MSPSKKAIILKEKIVWYIKAHSHSSIGGLNIIKLFFDMAAKENPEILKLEKPNIIGETINVFDSFSSSKDIDKSKKILEQNLDSIKKLILLMNFDKKYNDLEVKKKREELLNILKGVRLNIDRIENIIKNPEYRENFKLKDIIFSSLLQTVNQYPNRVFGNFIGHFGERIGTDIEIDVDCSDTLFFVCCGYELQLLFFNLLSNAIDAIKKTGKINVTVKSGNSASNSTTNSTTNSKNESLEIIVSNTGCISQENIEKINEKIVFSTKSSGHGYGLKIIGDIVTNYNGDWNAQFDSDKNLVIFKISLNNGL